MSSQDLRTTVLILLYPKSFWFPHLSPIYSLKCSHKEMFLIYCFQIYLVLPSSPTKVSPQLLATMGKNEHEYIKSTVDEKLFQSGGLNHLFYQTYIYRTTDVLKLTKMNFYYLLMFLFVVCLFVLAPCHPDGQHQEVVSQFNKYFLGTYYNKGTMRTARSSQSHSEGENPRAQIIYILYTNPQTCLHFMS